MNYQCYGCQKLFCFDDLAAECMCFREEKPQYRGVCKPCAENKIALQIEEPEHHHLKKIHQYSEECNQFWKNVEDMCPSWSGFTFNKHGDIVFNHPNFPEGVKSWKEMEQKFGKEAANNLAYSEQRSKCTEFPISYDQLSKFHKCTCCN